MFTFIFDQVQWILENYRELSGGIYPDGHNSFELLGSMDKRRRSGLPHAYFENPCLLCAEVARRVRRCGYHGLIVEERYGLGKDPPKSEEEIAKQRNINVALIYKWITKVTWYCTGRVPRWEDRRKGGKKIKGETYDEWRSRTRSFGCYRDKRATFVDERKHETAR